MAACAVEVDVCTMKQQRAKSRVRDIAAKRADYQKPRSMSRTRSSAPADRVKPHRIARTTARSFIARGLVQTEADMPSITSMERSTSAHARKKPSVAAMVSCGADLFDEPLETPLNECSEAEVVAFLGKSFKKADARIPGLAPPASNTACVEACEPAVVEVTAQAQATSRSEVQELEEGSTQEASDVESAAVAACDPGLDICALKMRRAASRKRHIAAKRADYQRARSTPRSRSSVPADRIKPHRLARTAARTFVAKGFVEGESDMPSLTSMGKRASVNARKKPSVAPLVQSGFTPSLEKSIFPLTDGSDFDTTASESEDVHKALLALRTESTSDSESGAESTQSVPGEAEEQEEQPLQLELEQELAQNETKVQREFVGRILDFEIQEAEAEATPEPIETGWEVLPGAASALVGGRGAGRGWWNIFF